MMYQTESASELFSRLGKVNDVHSFEENLFPNFSSEDIVELSGEAGSCKTELLYHLIARCVFPPSWKGIELNGLDTEVTFIDNDCHFDLFRFISILEHRVKSLVKASSINLDKKEIFLFIQDRLKSLHIIKCYDSDEFILALCSVEDVIALQKKKKFLMIDGLSSFYWLDRARVQNNLTKLSNHYKVIVNLIIKLAKSYKIPVITSRRKLLSAVDSDKKVFGTHWNSVVSWKLELKFKTSLSDKTLLTLSTSQSSSVKLCCVNNLGFQVMGENEIS